VWGVVLELVLHLFYVSHASHSRLLRVGVDGHGGI